MKRKEPEPGGPALSLTYFEQICSTGQRLLGPGAPGKPKCTAAVVRAAAARRRGPIKAMIYSPPSLGHLPETVPSQQTRRRPGLARSRDQQL